jgi:hypothetical protein
MQYASVEATPIDSVKYLEPYIKDKVVYDVGAGDGKFALTMSQYAKQVIAVEIVSPMAAECFKLGLDVIEKDFCDISFKKAEVIYTFMSFYGSYVLTQKLKEDKWTGTVISHFYALNNGITDMIKPDKIIHAKVGSKFIPFLIYNL